METIVIWYKLRENQTSEVKPYATGNINLWRTSTNKISLDFGLKIFEAKNIETISIFIPELLEKKDIEDLGKLMINNSNLQKIIFNSTISSKKEQRDNHSKVEEVIELNGDNEKLFLFSFENSEKFCIQRNSNCDASILTFNLKEFIADSFWNNEDAIKKGCYFRFRISLSPETILLSSSQKHWYLQGTTSTTETTEIRINDFRLVENERLVVDGLDKGNLLRFNKFHFLMMRNFLDKLVDFSFTKSDSRLLESDIWSPYMSSLKLEDKNKVIAYHFKKIKEEKEPFSECIFFVKFQTPRSDLIKIFVYLFFFVCLSISANIEFELFKKNQLYELLISTPSSEFWMFLIPILFGVLLVFFYQIGKRFLSCFRGFNKKRKHARLKANYQKNHRNNSTKE